MNLEIDYEKLTERQLRDLVNKFDPKAEEEFDRRIRNGEIKRRKYTFEELEKLFGREKEEKHRQ